MNGLTFSGVSNLDYAILDPYNSTLRTASTQFRLEYGNNALDFSYSSGTNTVFNTGGSTTVQGGAGTDIVVGGTSSTYLGTDGGTD